MRTEIGDVFVCERNVYVILSIEGGIAVMYMGLFGYIFTFLEKGSDMNYSEVHTWREIGYTKI